MNDQGDCYIDFKILSANAIQIHERSGVKPCKTYYPQNRVYFGSVWDDWKGLVQSSVFNFGSECRYTKYHTLLKIGQMNTHLTSTILIRSVDTNSVKNKGIVRVRSLKHDLNHFQSRTFVWIWIQKNTKSMIHECYEWFKTEIA